jgi:hypothetical protein
VLAAGSLTPGKIRIKFLLCCFSILVKKEFNNWLANFIGALLLESTTTPQDSSKMIINNRTLII